MKKNSFYYCLLLLLLVIGCAKRGSISGGLKDTIQPVLKISFPKNYSTGFNGNTIKLTFDEYVKLKDIGKQLIISPPISKKPQISPLTASKTITVTFGKPIPYEHFDNSKSDLQWASEVKKVVYDLKNK